MATTTNKGLSIPTPGSESGTWGTDINNNTFTPLDLMLGGIDAIALSATNYTLSASEIQNLLLKLSGTLLQNVTVWTSCIGFFAVENNTTGSFTVTLQAITAPTSGTPLGSTFVIPQGIRVWFVSDAAVGLRVVAWMSNSLSTALAGLAADQIIYATGASTFSATAFTSTARSLAALTNAPAVKGALELDQAITASGASLAIDMSLGWNVALTLSATVTSFTVSNWPASGKLGRLLLEITSTGAFNITGWPGTTIWAGGTKPTITSGAGKKDTIVLTSSDGGTNFRGYVVSQNMS